MQKSLYALVCLVLVSLYGCGPSYEPQPYEQCQAITYPAPGSAVAPYHVEGQRIKDQNGRTILLRGVNATGDAKIPPFESLADPSALDPLPGWGIRVVRLLFNWEAFEPSRCQHDSNYLDYYEDTVTEAAARGLQVIVDFHQDAYSRFSHYGCGEGFPAWAVSSAVPLLAPDNSESCANWGASMLTDPSLHLTWTHFFSDFEGARSRYLDMVEAVAHRLSSHSNVIGYELINEPWGTDLELLAFFNDVGNRIRERHPDAILFVPYHALGSGGKFNTMPKPNLTNFVYSPHFYDSSVWLSGSYSPPLSINQLADHINKANAWNVPLLLSEFGATPTTVNGAAYMEDVYQWLDQKFAWGTQWVYNPPGAALWNGEDLGISDALGQLRPTFVPKPFPYATSGEPGTFARNSSGFTYSWTNDPALGATEFYLPGDYELGKTLDVQIPSGSSNDCSFVVNGLVCNIAEAGLVQVSLTEP